MNIIALGWYGQRNEGDERIGYCLKKFVESRGHQLELMNVTNPNFDKLNSCDFVLYGGGGLIHRNFNDRLDLLENIKVPMGFVGISIEAHDDTNNEFVLKMLDKALFIYVRDKSSAKLLNYHPKVIQSDDLSFLYPFKVVDNISENTAHIVNLRSWQYWDIPYSSKIDKKLRKLSLQRPVIYQWLRRVSFFMKGYEPKKIMSVLKKKREIKGVSLFDSSGRYIYPVVASDTQLLEACELKTQNFSFDYLRGAKLVYSMRLHCTIFCIQMGIPCIALMYQPKNMGLLENMDLQEIGLSVFDVNAKTLEQKEQFVMQNYQMIRNLFLNYRFKASKDVAETMGQIFDLIEMQNKGGAL